MLGQDRFRHIRLVTAQALTLLNAALTLPSLITRLEELDSEISIVAPLSSTSPTKPTTDYKGLNTVEKAERLIKAREKRLELLVKMRKHEEEKAHAEEVQTDITEMAELDGRGQKGTADDEAAEAEPAPCRRGFDS
jgi:aspartate carbamoyltransferase catalytic subunit